MRWIGCQRNIYNSKVQEDRYFRTFARKSLDLTGVFAPVDQQYSQFKTELAPWLFEVPSIILRNGAVLWKQAYGRFFAKLGGRPTIQTKHGEQSVWLTSELFSFNPVTDPKTGEVSQQLHVGIQKFPVGVLSFLAHTDFKVPASLHISVHAGHWHVSFSYDNGVAEPSPAETAEYLRQFSEEELLAMTAGIDRGVKIPVAVSDGQDFDYSKVQKKRLEGHEVRKQRWQRRMARRTKGSRGWRKAKLQVARYCRYGGNVRRDVAHKTSAKLASDPKHRLFVFEALKVKNMTDSAKGTVEQPGKNVRQKAGLNRSILKATWGQTKIFLQYKARRQGKLCLDVPPHYSSQECAACGHIHPDNRPTQAEFVCQRCHNTDNADRNASKVIARRGVKLLLSTPWKNKEIKRCKITSKTIGVDCSKPAASPRTFGEITASGSHIGNSVPAPRVVEPRNPRLRPQG